MVAYNGWSVTTSDPVTYCNRIRGMIQVGLNSGPFSIKTNALLTKIYG